MTEKESAEHQQRSSPGPDWVERLATIISAVLVLGVIAVLVWDAVHPDRPPALEASAGTPRAVGRQWHVPIVVRNSGDVAAQEVNVSVSLQHPDTTVRDIDIRIDWLPGRSQRAIDAVFAVDPSRGKVTAQVQSFDEP